MAKQRSQTSKFKSPSTGENCTAAQYIAEILIQRKAESENKGSLAYKFWNKTQKAAYTRQVQSVSKLISEFGERAVFDYIVNKNKKVYSAMPKWVKEAVEMHAYFLSKKKEVIKQPKQIRKESVNSKPRKTYGKKTLFSKLRSSNGKSKEE